MQGLAQGLINLIQTSALRKPLGPSQSSSSPARDGIETARSALLVFWADCPPRPPISAMVLTQIAVTAVTVLDLVVKVGSSRPPHDSDVLLFEEAQQVLG